MPLSLIHIYCALCCPCVKFPVCDFVIASAGLGPFPEVNVTVTVSGAAGMLKLQVVPPPPTTHDVGVLPLNVPVDPSPAIAVRMTAVPLAKLAEHVAAGGQTIPAGLLVTVPVPVPASVTVRVSLLPVLKVAVTVTSAVPIGTTHVGGFV